MGLLVECRDLNTKQMKDEKELLQVSPKECVTSSEICAHMCYVLIGTLRFKADLKMLVKFQSQMMIMLNYMFYITCIIYVW